MNDQLDSDPTIGAAHWLKTNFPRLLDLYEHSDKANSKNYFNVDFPLPLAEEEKRLARLDSVSWRVLRNKAAPYVCVDDPARRYQQLWNVLDEARGYVLLAEQGYELISFIEPNKSKKGGKQSPDLIGQKSNSAATLEVKTINESRDNLAEDATWRTEAVAVGRDLSVDFRQKVTATIEHAKSQLDSYPHPVKRKIVLLLIRFDHGQKTGWHLYSELKNFITAQTTSEIKVYYEALM